MTLAQLAAEGAPPAVRCEVWQDGDVEERDVLSGRVTFDGSRRVVRTCQLTVAGALPEGPNDPLAPSGSTLRLFLGRRDWTGEAWLEPAGRYVFDRVRISRWQSEISGYDFAQLVSYARWEQPYPITAGTNLSDAIVDAVRSRLPEDVWVAPNVDGTAMTVPATVFGEERDNDPWRDVEGLARGGGKLTLFARTGRLTVMTVPDPDAGPAKQTWEAGTSALLLDTERDLDGHAYNVVVVSGEPAEGQPVSATVEDTDPASPSFVGRYRRPYFMTSPYISTVQQATTAGTAELNRRKGVGETVTVETVVTPWLDVWDTVRVEDPGLHVAGRYTVQSLSWPLDGGAGRVTMRRRTL